MNYIIFEDHLFANLHPFTINHASFELRSGALTNIERIQSLTNENDKIYLIVRQDLCELTRERFPEFIVNPDIIPNGIHLNGATLWDTETIGKIEMGRHYSHQGYLIAMHAEKEIKLSEYTDHIKKSIQVTLDIPAVHFSYLWECIFALKNFDT